MTRATSSDPFRSRNQLCWSQKWASPVPLRARQQQSQELPKRNCGWVVYKLNMPLASHMGGVWRRQIQTVHNILTALLSHHGSLLDDESLCTFFADAESDCKLSSTYSWWPEQCRWSSCSCTMSVTGKEIHVVLPPPGVFEWAKRGGVVCSTLHPLKKIETAAQLRRWKLTLMFGLAGATPWMREGQWKIFLPRNWTISLPNLSFKSEKLT